VVGLQETKKLLSENKNLEALLIYSDEDGGLQTFITEGLTGFIELNANKK